jgi:hypothetical protein
MNSKIAILCCVGAVMFLAVGCAPSRVAMDYGTSFELQKYSQILNPEAEKNLEPVVGIDARAAQNIEDKYQKSFKQTQPSNTSYQFNIGEVK